MSESLIQFTVDGKPIAEWEHETTQQLLEDLARRIQQADTSGWLTADAGYCSGHPRIKGTRIPVKSVLAFLADGTAPQDIHDHYPNAPREAVRVITDLARRDEEARDA